MNLFFFQISEMLLIGLIGILTVIINPPLPLLAIPFLLIITMRTIVHILEINYSLGKQGVKDE